MFLAARARTVLALAVASLPALLAASSAGCSANVVLSDGCEVDGQVYETGETFPASDGCNTCTCEAGGAVSCSLLGCEECTGEQPDCGAPPPGCSLDYTCASGGWECVVTCDECGDAPPISCEEPPPGCYYTGPQCLDGQWTCGDLYCNEPCDGPPPLCEQPGTPNCEAYPVCTEFGWECNLDCWEPSCDEPPPACPDPGPGCDTFLECDEFGNWSCNTVCDPQACIEQNPGGYDFLLDQLFLECGCSLPSPCGMVCLMDPACETHDFDTECGSCVAQQTEGNPCTDEAVFGPACQGNAACAAVVECLLAAQ